MRPKSIVAPLLLIAVGVLFLLHNLWPEVAFYEVAAKYWPILLIIWGTVRLAEVLLWHTRGKPLPVSGVSGGEWTAVVLISLLGSGIFWGTRYASRWPSGAITVKGLEMFGEAFDFPVTAAKTVGKTPRIVLEMGRGNARIVGKDTEQIEITGRKTIRAFEQRDADRDDKRTPLEITFAGDRTVVKTNLDRLDNSQRSTADLQIAVPKGATVECRGRYGDFDITDVAGNVSVSSDNAGVRVRDIGGSLSVDLRRSDVVRAVNVKGAVEVKGRGQDLELEGIEGQATVTGDYSGEVSFRNVAKPVRYESSRTELRVEKTPGSVRMALGNITAEKVQGPIRLRTKSRDVQIRDFTDGLDLEVERGDIELRPSAQMGKLEARTNNGNVDLILPPAARFDLSAKTNKGGISNEFGAPLVQESHERGATLKGSNGQGPGIAINVDRGSITVRRTDSRTAAIPSAPAAPPVPPAAPKALQPPALQEQ